MAQQIPPDRPIRELLSLLVPDYDAAVIANIVDLLLGARISTVGAVPDDNEDLIDLGIAGRTVDLVREAQIRNRSPLPGEPEAQLVQLVTQLTQTLKREENGLEAVLAELWPRAFAGLAGRLGGGRDEIAAIVAALTATREALTLVDQTCAYLLGIPVPSSVLDRAGHDDRRRFVDALMRKIEVAEGAHLARTPSPSMTSSLEALRAARVMVVGLGQLLGDPPS